MANNRHISLYRFTSLQFRLGLDSCLERLWLGLGRAPVRLWKSVISFFLIAYLAMYLAQLCWLLLPAPVIPPAKLSSEGDKYIDTHKDSQVQIAQLKSLPIFGKIQAAPSPLSVSLPIVETRLDLVLLGVIASSHEPMARAIVANKKQQDIYAVGDNLALGQDIMLAKIMTDSVIIDNRGTLETLYLYNGETKIRATSVAAAAPLTQAMREWFEAHAEPEVVEPPSKPVIYSADQAITEVGRSMSNVLAMSVYQEGGKMTGYKIQPGRDAEKFKSLGLQTGDLVVAINGWPMSNPGQIFEMYQEMNLAGSASLQIKRGNNVMTVDVSLQ